MQGLDIVVEGEVGDTRALGVGPGPAQVLGRHHLVCDRLHHVRSSDEHVGAVPDHQDEVGHGRRVDGTTGAGAHDERDLRDHARGQDVALEHVGIAREARHPLLDAGPARIVEADDRRADLHGTVHDLADLLGMTFGQRAAEDGEVLAEDEDETAVDRAMARDHAVARDPLILHAEVGAAVLDEHIGLLEGARVEEQLQALARRELAALVLGGDAPPAAAEAGSLTLRLELRQDVLHRSVPLSSFWHWRGARCLVSSGRCLVPPTVAGSLAWAPKLDQRGRKRGDDGGRRSGRGG